LKTKHAAPSYSITYLENDPDGREKPRNWPHHKNQQDHPNQGIHKVSHGDFLFVFVVPKLAEVATNPSVAKQILAARF
jgi:hypothetical protein